MKHYVNLGVACSVMLAITSASADPTSQAEVDRMFPLPERFGGFDLFAARTLATGAGAVIDATLLDYSSARFRNVRAVLHLDWRSWHRDFYICGEINSKNGMGGYTGWQSFVVTEDKSGLPRFFQQRELAGAVLTAAICTRGREDRFVSDTSVDYAKILSGR